MEESGRAQRAACGRAGLWADPGHGRERGAGEGGAEHLCQREIRAACGASDGGTLGTQLAFSRH